MKKTFFPRTILQAIGLLMLAMVLSAQWIFIFNKHEHETIIFAFLFTLTFIGLAHLINRKRGIKLSYNFKLTHISTLPLMILAMFIFDVGISIPLNTIVNGLNTDYSSSPSFKSSTRNLKILIK